MKNQLEGSIQSLFYYVNVYFIMLISPLFRWNLYLWVTYTKIILSCNPSILLSIKLFFKKRKRCATLVSLKKWQKISPTCNISQISKKLYSFLMLSLDLSFNQTVLEEPYTYGWHKQKLFSLDVILGSYFQ